VWGNQSPKFYKWKFWTDNNDAHKMSPVSTTHGCLQNVEEGGGISQERMNISNLNQTQNHDRFGKIRWHHQWKRHYCRRHLKNPHLQEWTTVLDQWTSTTTKGKIMKQPQVGIREDACLSLAEGIMTLSRPFTASTTDLQPLERQMLPYKVRYKIIHNGK